MGTLSPPVSRDGGGGGGGGDDDNGGGGCGGGGGSENIFTAAAEFFDSFRQNYFASGKPRKIDRKIKSRDQHFSTSKFPFTQNIMSELISKV